MGHILFFGLGPGSSVFLDSTVVRVIQLDIQDYRVLHSYQRMGRPLRVPFLCRKGVEFFGGFVPSFFRDLK